MRVAAAGLSLPPLLAGCLFGAADLPPPPRGSDSLAIFGSRGVLPPEPPPFGDLAIPSASRHADGEDFRADGLRAAAMGWGAGHGRARRGWEIARAYLKREAELDEAWDFRRAALPAPMRAGFVLPPVIERAGAAWTGGADRAEAAEQYYRILRPARLSPRLPMWRDYLPAPAAPPDPPDPSLLPLEGEEEQWREWAAEGWHAGVELAETEHEEGLARLERDYRGMLEYRRLLSLGMLSDMVVEAESWPATADASELRIGGRRVTIVRDAGFVDDPALWTPRIVAATPSASGRR